MSYHRTPFGEWYIPSASETLIVSPSVLDATKSLTGVQIAGWHDDHTPFGHLTVRRNLIDRPVVRQCIKLAHGTAVSIPARPIPFPRKPPEVIDRLKVFHPPLLNGAEQFLARDNAPLIEHVQLFTASIRLLDSLVEVQIGLGADYFIYKSDWDAVVSWLPFQLSYLPRDNHPYQTCFNNTPKNRNLSSDFKKLPKKIFGMPPLVFPKLSAFLERNRNLTQKNSMPATPYTGTQPYSAFFRLNPSGV